MKHDSAPQQDSLWRNEIADRVAAHKARAASPKDSACKGSSEELRTQSERTRELSERALEAVRRRLEERIALEEAERREREELERFFAEFNAPVAPPEPPPAVKPAIPASNVIPFPSSSHAAAAAPAIAIEPPPASDQLTIFEIPQEPQVEWPEPEPEAPLWVPPLRLDEHLDFDHREELLRPESEFDLPLKVAPVQLRCWAGFIDAAIVTSCALAFCAIFYALQHDLPKQKVMIEFALLVLGAFWTVYQILFLSYAGATPGLKAMHLGISDFHDRVPGVERRLVRAISLVLTTMSLGIGFAWALFDEDRLGWHDRMTRTFPRQLA